MAVNYLQCLRTSREKVQQNKTVDQLLFRWPWMELNSIVLSREPAIRD